MFRLSITFHIILVLYNIYLILFEKTEMCFFDILNKKSDILKQEILKYVIFHKDSEKNNEKVSGF